MKTYFKNKEILFVKFPIIFPIIYFLILYFFPQFETHLIFLTILLLAETHFGATWPFFLNKINYPHIIQKKINFILFPILIAIFCLLGFVLFKDLFLLIFFAANVYHVTRQSFGIANLYSKNSSEKILSQILIYFFNFIFFIIAFFRFYIPIIITDYLLFLNLLIVSMMFISFSYYLIKYKYSENFLIFVTGVIIFYPVCFVSNPVHAIIMGVTMHYTQYLYLTNKVNQKRENNNSNSNIIYRYNYLFIIILYSAVMSILSIFGKFDESFLKSLIVIPITGQMLHFYLDSQLWKFSEKHNRENILKYL